MKLIPAIDLKNNKCVRLTQGKEQSAKVYNENPVEQAKYFEKEGCEKIHIVDLDAAFGRADINKETILNIRKSISIPIQLGGGIRNKDDVNFWLEKNIDYLIIGTIAVTNSDLVKRIAEEFENKIYIALDIKQQNTENSVYGLGSGTFLKIIVKTCLRLCKYGILLGSRNISQNYRA